MIFLSISMICFFRLTIIFTYTKKTLRGTIEISNGSQIIQLHLNRKSMSNCLLQDLQNIFDWVNRYHGHSKTQTCSFSLKDYSNRHQIYIGDRCLRNTSLKIVELTFQDENFSEGSWIFFELENTYPLSSSPFMFLKLGHIQKIVLPHMREATPMILNRLYIIQRRAAGLINEPVLAHPQATYAQSVKISENWKKTLENR